MNKMILIAAISLISLSSNAQENAEVWRKGPRFVHLSPFAYDDANISSFPTQVYNGWIGPNEKDPKITYPDGKEEYYREPYSVGSGNPWSYLNSLPSLRSKYRTDVFLPFGDLYLVEQPTSYGDPKYFKTRDGSIFQLEGLFRRLYISNMVRLNNLRTGMRSVNEAYLATELIRWGGEKYESGGTYEPRVSAPHTANEDRSRQVLVPTRREIVSTSATCPGTIQQFVNAKPSIDALQPFFATPLSVSRANSDGTREIVACLTNGEVIFRHFVEVDSQQAPVYTVEILRESFN